MPRRHLLRPWAAALLLVLAGCVGSPGAPADSPSPATSTAPADPGVVVVLDDFAALNVLALGVTPDLVLDAFGYTTTKAILTGAGVTPKPYGQSLSIEQIAAADPDVIIGTSLPSTVQQKAALERLGTTAILDYTADWRTALTAAAQALGRQDQADRIQADVDGAIAELKADLQAAGQAGQPVSVIAGSTEGPFSPPLGTNLGGLLADLGLDRPAAQKVKVSASAPFVNVSSEDLVSHNGAALYLMEGRTYPSRTVTDSPLYRRLKAVKDGRAYRVSGEMWFGANPVSVQWVVDDIRATLIERKQPQPESSASTQMRRLVTATGS